MRRLILRIQYPPSGLPNQIIIGPLCCPADIKKETSGVTQDIQEMEFVLQSAPHV